MTFTEMLLCFAVTGCQTDLTGADIKRLEGEILIRNDELYELRDAVNRSRFTEQTLHDKDDKVSFYTGLPSFLVLMSVFKIVEPYVTHTSNNVLSKFEEMVVFLMRIRLGLCLQDIAYRFNVSQATVSRICEKWLDACFDRLGTLIQWPEKEEVMKTMPLAFMHNFGRKVRVILDCFEVFSDRPSAFDTRAGTWSQYKHHNTIKFLIGICPQGNIIFISKAYGGRSSDKFITEDCGVLQNLEYNDIVLADRGFLISESVGLCCAQLYIPPFTRGKRQLSASEVEHTRELANVRIHVERVIGLLRNKYLILKSCLPVELLTASCHGETPIDKIAVVCCALTNLCNSVVPMD